MNRLGSVIRHYRDLHGISRFELANGICSEKFIYLVETEKRSPSSIITEQLGERLGINLFDYVPYLSCKEPVKVKQYSDAMKQAVKKIELDKLQKLIHDARKIPDYHEFPWSYEVEFYHLIDRLHGKENPRKVLSRLDQMISKEEFSHLSQSMRGRFLLLMSVVSYKCGKSEQSLQYLNLVWGIVAFQKNNMGFMELIIATGLMYMLIYIHQGKYQKALEHGLEVYEYQTEQEVVTWLSFSLRGIAHCYEKIDDQECALQWNKRAEHCLETMNLHALWENPEVRELFAS